MENEFPPNSHAHKEARPERRTERPSSEKKEVVRITKGKATLRKKPLHKQFFDAFRPEDNVGFIEHLVLEVLVDSIKDAIAYTTTEAIENVLGTGAARRGRSRGRGRGSYTEYNRMGPSRGRGRRDRDDDDDRRRPSRREPAGSYDDREIILDTRVEAEEVLETMIELIGNYDAATKRDLLSMIGEPHTPVDEDWGWTDLRGARIHRIGQHGFLLDLPRAEYLD